MSLLTMSSPKNSKKEPTKYYWQSLEGLAKEVPQSENEFSEQLPIGEGKSESLQTTRREFLKLMGFSLAAASVAACEAPVRKAIPYLNKPTEIDPGIANYYATSYQSGSNSCGLIVKTREGRPIKVAGNPKDPLSRGGVSAQVEASVLDLYDTSRYKGPQKSKSRVSWDEIDKEIVRGLSTAVKKGAPIYLISRSYTSPSTKAAIAKLQKRYSTLKQVIYDNPSYSAVLDANRDSFGLRILPYYDFSAAHCVVSFSADFLGTYLAPTLFSKQFTEGRKISEEQKKMNQLFVFEANLSLTGANADYRTSIRGREEAAYLANLYNLIAKKRGYKTISAPEIKKKDALEQAANVLWTARGKALVLSGNNNYNEQKLCCAINYLLKSYGSTLHWDKPFYFTQGDDKAFSLAVEDIEKGEVGAVIFYDCNPVYEHPKGNTLAKALEDIPLSVSTSSHPNETSLAVQYIAPNHHYLEAWGDAEPIHGYCNLRQPTISSLFNTRQAESSFLLWSGEESDYFAFLKSNWRNNIYSKEEDNFQTFFDKCLHDGVYVNAIKQGAPSPTIYRGNLDDLELSLPEEGLQLLPYFSVALGSGEQAGNPWLQELPDPITKLCWENCLTVSNQDAKELGIYTTENETSVVALNIGERTIELPALIQPGQTPGTMGVALGYGRQHSNKVGTKIGVDLYTSLDYTPEEYMSYYISSSISVKVVGRRRVALMQTQHTFVGRQSVIQESTLSAYEKDEGAGRYYPKITTHKGKQAPGTISLWKGHTYANHHWGMAIDLNSCTGCNACVVSCQVENNIPVVGKEEVINRRDMHWLRIDRYYSSSEANLEQASENPEIVFQPMLCQHCNNAPCETVCPVAATTHSSEGLNQMTYNRCVGTRYCANNCPYKVRRFNWFKYHDNDQFAVNTAMHNALGKMVLNPDVTVRSRGVMEKCTFCVQRIQAGKLSAKRASRRPRDEEVKPACAAACVTGAIVFGDLKDENSHISQLLKLKENETKVEVREKRAYQVLEEVNTKPNIWYLTKIRNKENTPSV